MWFIVFVIGLFTAIWAFDWWPFQDELTVYPASCQNKNVTLKKCNDLILREPITYALNKQRAEATYIAVSGGLSIPYKLVNCVIVDRKNWRCKYPHSTREVTVLQGVRVEPEKRLRIVQGRAWGYIPRWRWHLVKTGLSK